MMSHALVAVIAGAFGLVSIWFQARVHRDNRSDHHYTGAAVRGVHDLLSEVRLDVLEIRDDVSAVRGHVHRLDVRLGQLEAQEAEKETTDDVEP